METVAVVVRSAIKSAYSCSGRIMCLRDVQWQTFYRNYGYNYRYHASEHNRVSMITNTVLPHAKTRMQLSVKILMNKSCSRRFHTSRPAHALPPVLLLMIRPVARIFAIMFGRSLHKWWKRLPSESREYTISGIRKYWYLILGLVTPFGGGLGYFYVTHLETDPITKRQRFIAYSEEQMKTLARIEQDVIMEMYDEKKILPRTHPVYQQVAVLTQLILKGNEDIEKVRQTKWSVIVIDDIDHKNAFVLPNGTIFVFTGILEMCDSLDQLGVVLSHEIAHVLLSHMTEQMSRLHLHELLMIVPIIVLWTIYPDLIAVVAYLLSGYFVNALFHLPYSRISEAEADEVGLQLAAKACLDLRQASVFWEKMATILGDYYTVEFLSTHPASDTRKKHLDSYLPEALELRKKCNCADLSSVHKNKFLKIEVPRNESLKTKAKQE